MKKPVSVLLVLGIIIVANILVQPLLIRFDFSKGRQYTLSKATKGILRNLEDQVTVTAYFSEGLPPDVSRVKRDFQDLLVEFAAASKGNLDFEFINPSTDEQKKSIAQSGIQPVMINVREKDQVKQQQAYLGAVIRMGTATEVLPFVQPGASMEYDLASAIKKLSVSGKPTVAFIQGHGEPSLNEMSQVVRELGALYNILPLDLNTVSAIPDTVKVAVLLAPKQALAPAHLDALDAYMAGGGQMVVGINRLETNMETATALANETGLEYWLYRHGVEVDTSLVIDVQCGTVTVPQYIGPIQVNSQVKFPYMPLVSSFADHPVSKGLEQVVFPYISPLRFLGGGATGIQFTPLLYSSSRSGIRPSPVQFEINNKQWLESDFPLSNLILGAVLSGPIGGGANTRMVVFGDGDFPLSGQQGRAMAQDNVHLLVNSVDWLGDDSGLLDLRTKTVTAKPLDAQYLLDETHGKRQLIKWLNVSLPVVLVILAGLLFQRRNARLRRRRMEEEV